jgi:hypothetical protein
MRIGLMMRWGKKIDNDETKPPAKLASDDRLVVDDDCLVGTDHDDRVSGVRD